MEYGYYKNSQSYPKGFAPKKRINANPYTNFLVKNREWYETLPAMQYLRQTEQSFSEKDIQEEYAGPNRIAEIKRRNYERLSDCQRYFRTDMDLTVPAVPIDPSGYTYYLQEQRNEEMLWEQMLSMKRSDDGLTPTPRTAETIGQFVAAAREQEARTENERSRSRGEHRS